MCSAKNCWLRTTTRKHCITQDYGGFVDVLISPHVIMGEENVSMTAVIRVTAFYSFCISRAEGESAVYLQGNGCFWCRLRQYVDELRKPKSGHVRQPWCQLRVLQT